MSPKTAGSPGVGKTVIVLVTPEVTPLHGEVFCLRTQYVVVEEGLTEILAAVAPDIILFPIVAPVPH